ncbi:triose-phosphate isomerase [Patescibacteria group bacterium]|nr:triose-phosphate isomerase [Patescibacteria group bacterium]MBU1931703.1 triose-phosphate isomerase [Patescibacteria group bacterium]
MIFLSLKTYKEASGEAVIKLLSMAKQVSEETGVPIIPCAQATDIYRIKQELKIEVWAQHLDPIDPGRNFGWISPYSLKLAGAEGAVINHAEHAVDKDTIKQTIDMAKKYGLKTLVICETIKLAKQVTLWQPDYIAYERADLIAGTISMIDEEEASVKQLAQIIKQPLIVGAGISTQDHVKKTLRAGGQGVILASAVVKADNPKAKLRELANGFKYHAG